MKSRSLDMLSLDGDEMLTEYVDPFESVKSSLTLVCLFGMFSDNS